MQTLKIKKLKENAVAPSNGSLEAAGYDLYAAIDHEIKVFPHETVLIDTGLAMAIPEGYFGGIYARSGLATKQGLRPSNCVGVVDSDYRGSVKVALHNDSGEARFINPGDRVAQLIIQPYTKLNIKEVGELDDTQRGSDGFGSTGLN